MPRLKYKSEITHYESEEERREAQREYNRWYYQTFKARIAERRKQWWERNREKLLEERRERYVPRTGKRGTRGKNLPRLGKSRTGRFVVLYSISVLSQVLDRHIITIRSWIKKGCIPVQRDEQSGYWVTEPVLDGCRRVYASVRCLEGTRTKRAEGLLLREALREYFYAAKGKKTQRICS